jgi:hypothetical protein
VVDEHQGDGAHLFWRLVEVGKQRCGGGLSIAAMEDDKKKIVEGALIGF